MAKLIDLGTGRFLNLDNVTEVDARTAGADAAVRVDMVTGVPIWLYGNEARVMRAYLRSEAENVLRTLRRRGVEGYADTTPAEDQ